MFIQTEQTPNPLSIKFLPGVAVTGGETLNIASKDDAHKSPLALELFKIENVAGVFLGSDFVTVTKTENSNWDYIKPEVLVCIMDHLVSGMPVLASSVEMSGTVTNENDSELVAQIKEIIEHRVRPAVAQDGGDIRYVDFVDGIVKLELQGSCSGCPSSTVTLKDGIESMLKHYVPEVIAVEAV